jgi:hypothetical protein
MMTLSGSSYSSSDIDDVFDMISKNSNKSLKFVEIHSETLFTKEIKLTGIVSFSSNGAMSKYIITPKKSEIHIVNNTLSLLNSEGVSSVSLTSYPVLASSINAIRWILLGEKDKISENYSISYSNKNNNWAIDLIPVDEKVLLEVSNILITGGFGNIGVIMLIKTNGDSITTTFSKLKNEIDI